MVDVQYFKPIVETAAKRIAYKMDAWDELEDIQQEMWLALVEDSDLCSLPDATVSRRLGTVGARWVLSQKNLGMVIGADDRRPEALSSPLDRELVEWVLPQLSREHREVIRQALGDRAAGDLPAETRPGNVSQGVSQDIENVSRDISRSDVDHSDVRTLKPILKDAFKALSEVVILYEG